MKASYLLQLELLLVLEDRRSIGAFRQKKALFCLDSISYLSVQNVKRACLFILNKLTNVCLFLICLLLVFVQDDLALDKPIDVEEVVLVLLDRFLKLLVLLKGSHGVLQQLEQISKFQVFRFKILSLHCLDLLDDNAGPLICLADVLGIGLFVPP